jgi:hypothetical protein
MIRASMTCEQNIEPSTSLAALSATIGEWPVDVFTAVRTVITLALLAVSLFVIVSRKCREREKNWAYTTIGALTGFWFRDLS